MHLQIRMSKDEWVMPLIPLDQIKYIKADFKNVLTPEGNGYMKYLFTQ